MSPHYSKFAEVKGSIQTLVSEELQRLEKDIHILSQTGFAFVLIGEIGNQKVKIESLEDLRETQIKDAARTTSNRHVIFPMKGSSKHNPLKSSKDRPPQESARTRK